MKPALRPCPTCGKDVSTAAAACPHCGHQFKAAGAFNINDPVHKWGCIGIVVLVLIGIVMMFGIR